MIKNETRTASRRYGTTEYAGLWRACYQPLNPKTGQPWQAWRIISGHDCYRLDNWKTGASTGIIPGKLPLSEVWTKVDGGMTGANTGFSSEALALAAIAGEKARSGK